MLVSGRKLSDPARRAISSSEDERVCTCTRSFGTAGIGLQEGHWSPRSAQARWQLTLCPKREEIRTLATASPCLPYASRSKRHTSARTYGQLSRIMSSLSATAGPSQCPNALQRHRERQRRLTNNRDKTCQLPSTALRGHWRPSILPATLKHSARTGAKRRGQFAGHATRSHANSSFSRNTGSERRVQVGKHCHHFPGDTRSSVGARLHRYGT
ncbi:hypothetical protein EV126DRAFT_74210 [Verticillium dahliae]|nr:hypothetical protein EV126DRAFT_74210 [Verticillium dahliae]